MLTTMNTCLFEDFTHSHLLPLTYAQPDFELRCGMFTAYERLLHRMAPRSLSFFVRDYLAEVVAERTGIRTNDPSSPVELFLNGCVMLSDDVLSLLHDNAGRDAVVMKGDRVLAVLASSDALRSATWHALMARSWRQFDNTVKMLASDTICMTFPWDIIENNPDFLRRDGNTFPLGIIDPEASIADSAEILHTERVHIAAKATIAPRVIIDASDGPVVIDQDAQIMHNAVIIGPAYVGRMSKIKIGAKIYEGTSIGPSCKIGGEVEETVFHSFANKQHEGFAGHSYFGPWTNLGADTNTSDLKNDYSEVRMVLEGVEYRTGRMLLGTIMADHSKCGINTMFNTGTCIGVGCNIYGADYPPKTIPSFAWGGSGGFREYIFRKFASVASTVLPRRNKTFTPIEQAVFRHIFELTVSQRSDFLQ